MPRSSKKKKRSSTALAEASELSSLNPLRAGMPALDSILSITPTEEEAVDLVMMEEVEKDINNGK